MYILHSKNLIQKKLGRLSVFMKFSLSEVLAGGVGGDEGKELEEEEGWKKETRNPGMRRERSVDWCCSVRTFARVVRWRLPWPHLVLNAQNVTHAQA